MSSLLSAYDSTWKSVEPKSAEDNASVKLPDGEYDARVTMMETKASKKDGTPIIVWHLRVKNEAGEVIPYEKISFLNERGIAYVKGDFERVGVVVDRVSDLERYYDTLTGAIVHMRLDSYQHKNGRTYQNNFIISLVKPSGKPAPTITEDEKNGFIATDEDDLPF